MLLVSQSSIAQVFIHRAAPFEHISEGDIVSADIDNDGDLDILLSGIEPSGLPITKLYTNDGLGVFMEVPNTTFTGAYLASAVFADVNGDNAPDIFLSGIDSSNFYFTKLYINNGVGIFIEKVNTNIKNIQGTIAVADVDGDNDQDMFQIGFSNTLIRTSTLYENDGNGNFTEIQSGVFRGFDDAKAVFGDVDGDNDLDLIISGYGISPTISSWLYNNDGNGNFTEVSVPFEGVTDGSIALVDINGDNFLDFIETGFGNSWKGITKTYINNGLGTFTEITNTLEQVRRSKIAVGDYDKDGDEDLVLTGINSSYNLVGKLYENDGTGIFTEQPNENIQDVSHAVIAFIDIDKDSDLDLIVGGNNANGNPSTRFYLNRLITTSLDELNNNDKLNIQLTPNPADERVNIHLNIKKRGKKTILIHDINGRLVYQSERLVNSGDVIIPLEIGYLSQGVYFVQITGKEITNTKGVRLIVY